MTARLIAALAAAYHRLPAIKTIFANREGALDRASAPLHCKPVTYEVIEFTSTALAAADNARARRPEFQESKKKPLR
jgi:hypothetical protein